MRCWNCGNEVSEKAAICCHCEAKLDLRPTPEQRQFVEDLLKGMDPKSLDELKSIMTGSPTAEDFANAVMVGDCPECGSDHTGDCGDDPEVEDPCVGRCLDCGHYWCLECGEALDPKKPACDCWSE